MTQHKDRLDDGAAAPAGAAAVVRLTPAWGVLPVLRFVTLWYLALFFALFATMSWRWEVVAGAALLGAGLDLLRRPAVNAMLAAARTAAPGDWSYRSSKTRRLLVLGVILAIAYCGTAAALIWVWPLPLYDSLLAPLDLLWNAGRNVRALQTRGFAEPARVMGLLYIAITGFILLASTYASFYFSLGISITENTFNKVLQRDPRTRLLIPALIALILFCIFVPTYVVYWTPISFDVLTDRFNPQINSSYVYKFLVAAIFIPVSTAMIFWIKLQRTIMHQLKVLCGGDETNTH